MMKIILVALLSFNVFFSNGSVNLLNALNLETQKKDSGTLEKMIAANGSVAMEVDLNLLNGKDAGEKGSQSTLRFDIENDSFFTVLAFNGEFRGAMPGSMRIIPKNSAGVPAKLKESYNDLIVENQPWGGQYEFVVRDSKTGLILFNIEGQEYDYFPKDHVLNIRNGRLLISPEFADKLERPANANAIAGTISVSANMRAIEVSQIIDGEVTANVLPANTNPEVGTVPGPDVVVGDITGLAQFGSSSGTQVGLAVGTDSCNFGAVDLNWFALPSNDHPVIPQNLYRMSGGPTNDQRFEQIGQSSVKHAFTALTNNICSLGCNGVGGTRLGSGCSDPYSASLNAGPNLGSRAWINPFTGAYPRGDSATPPNNHGAHAHTGPSHRILTEISSLNTSLNAGATYYAEGQYVTPHEYAWCQANPTQCNMNNNVSYRRYNVTGTASPFSFSPAAATVRAKPAISAWTGATLVDFRPDSVADGVGTVGYKVTNPSPGVWHYEYAVYNQNLDRGIQSFSVPLGAGATLSNIGFNAPPQHPGSVGDGTVGDAGFSGTAWSPAQTATEISWGSQSLAQNPNANAIRWGTMYNFRFDSNRPPETKAATIGFFKTGAPITVQIQAPSAVVAVPKSRADFDGDGKTDMSVFRGSQGVWYLNRSTAGFNALGWGIATDTLVPGDYDNDNKTDVAVFRANATVGQPDFYVLNSNGNTISGVDLGTTGDVPYVGDYDGDGKTDYCVRRPSSNTFFIQHANGTTRNYTFGLADDKIVNGDFDGDAKADFGVYRASTGTWYYAKSSDNAVVVTAWGLSTDIPVFADFDGDNKDDIAVFRPSDGRWYIRNSGAGTTSVIAFGTNGDIPVPGDYDGDGKDDQAVYRNGIWYINASTSGFSAASFGLATDSPIPREYMSR